MNKTLNIKVLCLFVFLFFAPILRGQNNYLYKRPLSPISDIWHSITLNDSMYEHLNHKNDIRILGITNKGDTLEVPYISQEDSEMDNTNIPFTLLNKTYNEKGFFYTLQTAKETSFNTILLNFQDKNFDWLADIEGSHNQKTWFTIAENQRLTGISNTETQFQYTKLTFEKINYPFIRICIKTNKEPLFQSAELLNHVPKKRDYREFSVKNAHIEHSKTKKQTIITLDLGLKLPILNTQINIENKLDYNRPFSIRYRTDTIQPQIWHSAYYGHINSKDNLSFEFAPIITDALQIIIENGDNMPLDYGKVTVKGQPYTLLARFAEKAQYFLFYGNKKQNALPPQYDITNFRASIPNNPPNLSLGFEAAVSQNNVSITQPFFNRWWLWGIMLIIIFGLGYQTLKMMREKTP